ncbi:MAG: Flp family type IVb pilin [Burkholderiaceae bacterium]|nr:Flp family type IVb pilin [Burkholderiaceae bacterium]
MRNFIKSLAHDERGVTALEYALLGVIVVGVLGVASTGFSGALQGAFDTLITGLGGTP